MSKDILRVGCAHTEAHYRHLVKQYSYKKIVWGLIVYMSINWEGHQLCVVCETVNQCWLMLPIYIIATLKGQKSKNASFHMACLLSLATISHSI